MTKNTIRKSIPSDWKKKIFNITKKCVIQNKVLKCKKELLRFERCKKLALEIVQKLNAKLQN